MNSHTASISRAKVRASSASESSMFWVCMRMSKSVNTAVATTNMKVSTSSDTTRKLILRILMATPSHRQDSPSSHGNPTPVHRSLSFA